MNEIENTSTAPQELTFEVLPPPPPAPPPPPGPRLRHALTLANLWHVWIGLKNSSPTTVLQYQHVARKFCKFFGTRANGDHHRLTPQGMLEWMQMLQRHTSAYKVPKPLCPARINKINSITKAFLRWMKQMHYINEDLASCIPWLMQPAPKEPLMITEEEYEKVKKWTAGKPHYQTHLWLCILAYRTGMSLVDCCHLRWKDVHLNDNGPSYIDIYRIKIKRFGEKARCQIPIVPFSDLHLWLLNLKNVEVWKRKDGITDYVHQETEGLYRCAIGFHKLRNTFRHIFRHAGVDKRKTFKCFRNSLCSNLVNSGMSIPLVCSITGHNSVKTLLRYLKPDRRALQDGVAKAQQFSSLKTGIGKGSDGFQDGDAAFL